MEHNQNQQRPLIGGSSFDSGRVYNQLIKEATNKQPDENSSYSGDEFEVEDEF